MLETELTFREFLFTGLGVGAIGYSAVVLGPLPHVPASDSVSEAVGRGAQPPIPALLTFLVTLTAAAQDLDKLLLVRLYPRGSRTIGPRLLGP